MEPYPSDLSDKEWNLIRQLLPAQSNCWRALPHGLPPWSPVYCYFSKWHEMGVWQRLNDALRDRVRLLSGKKAPSAAIIDSQSAQMAGQPGERGYDAGKKVDGRKRHLLVDSPGMVLAAVVRQSLHEAVHARMRFPQR